MGLFHPFVQDRSVRMIGVEAAGDGVPFAAAVATSGPFAVLGTTVLADETALGFGHRMLRKSLNRSEKVMGCPVVNRLKDV